MTNLNEAFAPPSAEELTRAPQASSGSAQGSAYAEDLVAPVPPGAPAPHFRHPELGQPIATWRYADASGATLGFVARFDPPGTRKQFIPRTLWRDAHGLLRWRWRSWLAPRPLSGDGKV
jgi:putative DNA primase/helicase